VTLTGEGSNVGTGSVKLTATDNTVAPAGLGIFSFASNGITVSEASVPIEAQSSAFRLYVESYNTPETGEYLQSAIALANPTSYSVLANIELRSADESVLLNGSVTIPAGGQIAQFVKELIPETPEGFNGVLRVTTTKPVAAIGLRLKKNERGDYLMSTTPSVSESTDSSNPQWFIPYVVTGNGYSTEFMIFSRKPGQFTAGSLIFTGKDGSPISWQ